MSSEALFLGWFGPSWHHPVNQRLPQLSTPIGALCAGCKKPIEEGHQGVVLPSGTQHDQPWHVDCFYEWVGDSLE